MDRKRGKIQRKKEKLDRRRSNAEHSSRKEKENAD